MGFFDRKKTSAVVSNEAEVINYVEAAKDNLVVAFQKWETLNFSVPPFVVESLFKIVYIELENAINHQKKVGLSAIKDASIVRTGFRAEELKKDRFASSASFAIIRNLEFFLNRTKRIMGSVEKLNQKMLKNSMESMIKILEGYEKELRKIYRYEKI